MSDQTTPPVLSHEDHADDVQRRCGAFAKAFADQFEIADQHSDPILLEDYFVAMRRVREAGGLTDAFQEFERAAEALGRQRAWAAAAAGYDAGYEAALAALGREREEVAR